MRSKDKLEVWTRRMPEYGNKIWCRIYDRKTGLEIVPSFEDFRRIALALWRCEELNYPPPKFLGGQMFRNMIAEEDFWNPEIPWEVLGERYQIPARELFVVS